MPKVIHKIQPRKYHEPKRTALAYQQRKAEHPGMSNFVFSAATQLNLNNTTTKICFFLLVSSLIITNANSIIEKQPKSNGNNNDPSTALTRWKPNYKGIQAEIADTSDCWTESMHSSSVFPGLLDRKVCTHASKSYYFFPLEKDLYAISLDYCLRFIKDNLNIHVPNNDLVYDKTGSQFYVTTEKQERWEAGALYEFWPGEECFSFRQKLAQTIDEKDITKLVIAKTFFSLNGLTWGITDGQLSITSVWGPLLLKSLEDYIKLSINTLGAHYANKDCMLHDHIPLTRNDLTTMIHIYSEMKAKSLPVTKFKSATHMTPELYSEILDLYIDSCTKAQNSINKFASSFAKDTPNYEINRILAGFIAKGSSIISLPYSRINWNSFDTGYIFKTPDYGNRC